MTDAEAGLKFEGPKLFWDAHRGQHLAFAYCGPTEMARTLFRSIRDELNMAFDDASDCDLLEPEYFRQALLPTFKSKDAKGMLTLIGLQTKHQCFLLRTSGERIAIGGREHIGGGDSSVLRYFADVSCRALLTSDDATAVGIYMVMLANRYVDGCGFGVDAVALEPGKAIRIVSEAEIAKYSERFSQFERLMEKEFFAEPR